MFWDKMAFLYDFFETVYNKKVFVGLGKEVAKYIVPSDRVLECACGTGAITVQVAPFCKELLATDYSDGMLKQARKKCRQQNNVMFQKINILSIPYEDNSFDKVIAGNVIHLLDDPKAVMSELQRVCKPGGTLIIPTYINNDSKSANAAAKLLELIGADFKRQFGLESYKDFFKGMGFESVEYDVVNGRMSCAIAIIVNQK